MLAILHAEPRLLIATVITRWLAILVVVPHGPHIDDNDDTAPETFWRKATTLTNKYRTHASRICVLTDANADFHSNLAWAIWLQDRHSRLEESDGDFLSMFVGIDRRGRD